MASAISVSTVDSELWQKLGESKEYREAFVTALVKRAFSLQLRTLRKARGYSQEKLAEEAKLTQGVVSRAEDPDYGNLTFNTVFRLVGGYDLAFIPKVVTFSEFSQWVNEVSSGFTDLPSFAQEQEQVEREGINRNNVARQIPESGGDHADAAAAAIGGKTRKTLSADPPVLNALTNAMTKGISNESVVNSLS